ncbi:hypothetical protein L249_5501 [Ophiocordyceps polyrhachis-furcata BCC 54312]|uniref:Uncharacterized protein n=1 Tax=Ophiocordyceps polyrhachis-furcata BCC 54312 TaxID=1330021 RepID=A0A367LGG3_9HYPO|nr:hypothetical protein L249_5501 [Ophiocordyceps polyrhachis-furcata BCC 54312]
MGIVIAARELGKSDFLSVRHDFSMRKNVGKKWVCLLKSVGKVESNEVFCGAVEEEEGGEKLVESLSNKVEADNKLEVVLYYSTITWLYVTPFLQRVDRLQRADRCDGCLPHCDSGRCGGP